MRAFVWKFLNSNLCMCPKLWPNKGVSNQLDSQLGLTQLHLALRVQQAQGFQWHLPSNRLNSEFTPWKSARPQKEGTLPETNSSHLRMVGFQVRNLQTSRVNPPFSRAMPMLLVSGRVYSSSSESHGFFFFVTASVKLHLCDLPQVLLAWSLPAGNWLWI